uniref:ATP-dependent RNA helicase DeaD n=1 Tax=uncultured Thiotrichaceae bacterium TaxID=298394 RepID=A0A6S6T155_9GAMM|nr:MAG: DEAD-box ATP-dependent RNA helicase CshA (EC [uncultured Thiotrichaceae bacterium]
MTESSTPDSSNNDIHFNDLALAEPILQAIREVGYETPSPIQAESIPPLLEGHDLLGQAQTGTGKTAAFALPLLSKVDLSKRHPQILVLAPTRELAIQVAEAMQTYARHLRGFHILPIYGGQSMGQQLRQLDRGVHVIVGTPGRVLDHLGRKSLKLDGLQAVVLDEADEMLRMGFIDDVDEILSHTPSKRQVALFSATMPAPIRRIAMRHLNEPVEIKIATKTSTVESITQRYWMVRGVHKLDALTRILEVTDFDAMIIFVRTKVLTEELAEKLEARGFSSAALNGDLNQQQRERTVERLKQSKLDIIVATDVAARGLDVPRISHVFNYDIPHDTESYVHRIGRTGRAGRSGEAILFVAPREKRMLYSIERATNQKIEPMQLPTKNEIVGHRIDQFKKNLDEVRRTEKLSFFRDLIQQYQTENELELEDVVAALAYMAQKDQPLQPKIQDEPPASPHRDRDRVERPDRGDRRERQDRGERGARNEGRRSEGRGREESQEPPVDLDMCRYRIEVGKEHGVQAKNIVGAIANEISLDSEYIDNISIRGSHTILDLPDGMPKDVFDHLKSVRVCGRPLNIAIDDGKSDDSSAGRGDNRGRGGDRDFKRGGGRPGGGKPRGGAGGKPRSGGSGAPRGRGKPSGGKSFGNGNSSPRKKS